MLNQDKQELAQVLIKTAATLDIPDHVYEDAVVKYEAVGEWLADDSTLKDFSPEVYPQGSFRLGTVVHPIADYDYDIDLVCLLGRSKEQTSQKELKKMVGDCLKKHPNLGQITSSGCRCWLLDYPRESNLPGFHMDVLPAIPNLERHPTGILLTDTDLVQWQKSNPKRYAAWFYERMRVILTEKRAAFAKDAKLNVEDVPEWQIKTPLQVAVQILKRHRDMYFRTAPDNRPVSIILTTLAALAYRNQPNVYDALIDIARDMPDHIERRNDRWWVPNPVEPEENFADRWNQYPERRQNFVRWLGKVQTDFSQLLQKQRLQEAVDSLNAPIGADVMTKVARDLGLPSGSSAAAVAATAVPVLGDASHRQSAPWLRQIQYRATVTGSVFYSKKHKKPLWPLTNRPVPKNLWLRFELQTDAPYPYEIVWQVVNTGKEAYDAGNLRGNFEFGDGIRNNVHWESTRYRGTHWIEGFVIKNRVYVAQSNPLFVRVR
jgi:Adenylyl/Guanylyl and SMODS C-terminal sensor domain/Second Messenger Oligonucleotide or Dinucleotide Synthetase domain